MTNALVQHALENLWCEPIQDSQYTLGLSRLTHTGGVSRRMTLHRETIRLPNYAVGDRTYFHVYQIGQLPPAIFNMEFRSTDWVSGIALAERDNTVIDVFLSNGMKVPLSMVWVCRTGNKNLLVAISISALWSSGITNLEGYKAFVRVYTNSLYDTTAWRNQAVDPTRAVRYLSFVVSGNSNYLSFKASKTAIANFYGAQGKGLTYIDGKLAPHPNAYDESLLGSTVSFYWDCSIKALDIKPLAQLFQFRSTLDVGRDKYAFIRNNGLTYIDYHDDVDFYLCDASTLTAASGVYFGRVKDNVVRQITHTAYALDKAYVDGLIAQHPFLQQGPVYILAVVRQGGVLRGLKPDSLRLDALYKLPANEVMTALTNPNVNETIPEWYVANLEASAYNRVMRTPLEHVDTPLVEEAYGYNAATLVVAPTLYLANVTPQETFISVPQFYRTPDKETNFGRRTLWVYEEGRLVGWFNNTTLAGLIGFPGGLASGDMAECFNALASNSDTGNIYDTLVVESTKLAQYGFRCYVCPMIGGVPNEEWVDVTDSPYYTYTTSGALPRITWDQSYLDSGNLFCCVRIGGWVSVTSPDLTIADSGHLEIDITETVVWQGNLVTKPLTLAPGVVDVFMDGMSLMRNVDYYMQWPKIVICRTPLNIDQPADILIRYYGWCNPNTMRPDLYRERSYVKEGILSMNCRYDIRNDRNNRIVVGGLLKAQASVRFAEETSGQLSTDGRPYTISDYAIAVENFGNMKTVPYRMEAVDLDERVMDYLTERLGLAAPLYPTIVSRKWTLMSPFLNRALHDMLDGTIPSVYLDDPYTDEMLDLWMTDYVYLLEFDPAIKNTQTQYVTVYIHDYPLPTTVTLKQFRFMEALSRRFLAGRVDVTRSLVIG